MKSSLSLQLMIYRILSTKLGSLMLKLLSFGISVDEIKAKAPKTEAGKKPPEAGKKPFIIAITVDTESGYTKNNEKRIWQILNPKAFIGFCKGIENWRNILNKYNIKATFFVSTQCFNSDGDERKDIIRQLNLLIKENHEIGLHIHPDSDLALQKALGRKFGHTSAKYFDYDTKKEIIKASKNLLLKNTKALKNIVSFRWGNWGLDTESVRILEELGFRIDSSAVPGIKGHINDGMFYDWKAVNMRYPWLLSKNNYKNTSDQDSKVLEIPIATFSFFGVPLRADPVNLEILNKSFEYYYKNADRIKKPFVFVVISHSSEGTYKDGRKTKVLETIEKFIAYASKYSDVKFMALKGLL